MAEPIHISKQASAEEGLDFNALRDAGIKQVQALSGLRWTDFNLHDPGVTILEALCYCLSDLAYRTGFDVADYFVGADGIVDFDGLALFRPDEVLTCDPVTVEDMRKAILDEIPEVRNVWLERNGTGPLASALYSAYVELADDSSVSPDMEPRVRGAVGRCRPLGEDVEGVHFVRRERFGLRGEIEIADDSDPLSVLAEVHWRAQNYLNPRPSWHSYTDAFARQPDLDQLLRGPLLETGWMADGELGPWRDRFFVSELIGILADVGGVERVSQLCFVGASGAELDSVDLSEQSAGRRVAELDVAAAGNARVTVLRAGRREEFDADDVERELARLVIQRNEFQSREQRFDWIGKLMPRGTARPFSEYHSIQHHFPDVYGLNAFGLPPSADAKRHGQALQLKAYLLMQEQLLANFLAQIKHIPELFAIEPQAENSYAVLPLDNHAVPRIEEIYPQGIADQFEKLEAIFGAMDDSVERRHRQLNRLLAMHGHDDTRQLADSIAQARGLSPRDSLPAKRYLLTNIRDFSGHRMRGGGIEGMRPGLERNLGILFGAPDAETGEYHAPIRVVDHILLREELKGFGADLLLFRVSVVVSEAMIAPLASNAQTLLERAVALCCPAHISASIDLLDEPSYTEFAALVDRCMASRPGTERGKAAAAFINILTSHS
jgi:hypothetical protein